MSIFSRAKLFGRYWTKGSVIEKVLDWWKGYGAIVRLLFERV